jgi:glycosyltransferase involved in cell wall biosynthesis
VKILHIIQRYPPAVGGSELWCREICQYLATTGDEVRVLTLNILEEEEFWRDPPLEKRTLRLGRIDWDGQVLVRRYQRSLPVYVLHHLVLKHCLDRLLKVYFYGPHSVEMYGRMFAEVKASDVVHLHTIPYSHNFIGYLAARLFRKRVVITPYFHPGHPHYERWCHYLLLKRCDAVLVLSESEREHLAANGVDRAKIIVTGCGIHVEEYAPRDLSRYRQELFDRYDLSEATKIVLFIGRKAEYKGVATLVEAVKRLLPRDDLALILMGPSLNWFEEFYRQLPSEEKRRIIDLGTLSHQEKVNLLHLSNLLVLPSQFESFGIVFLEAWACGTPVIGSSRGAIPSVIGDGGLTFEYGNATDLAGKIEILLKDERLSHELALNGRRKITEQYTWEKIGMATRKTYLPEKQRQMRILICSALFPPHMLGGAELVAYKHAKILQELGHEVRIFCGRLGTALTGLHRVTTTKKEFHTTWVSLSPKDMNGDSWDFHNHKIRQAFSDVLEDFSPDVVHFHNLAGLSVKMIDECQQQGIPTVMTLHDYWGICFKNTMIKNDGSICMKGGFDCLGCKEILLGEPAIPSSVRNAHILLSLGKIDRFIAPSQYLAERYAANGIRREKIAVINNGIDLERFKAIPKKCDKFTLGFIGYLGRHKGLDFLLRALALLHDLEKIRLLIVGDGEEAGHLKSLCRDLNLEPYVTFHGRVENQQIPMIYERIDVLVVPSIWPENSPVTITEAMASGIPVIAFDIGGIGELVDEGVTGFLVPPKDVQAMAERIDHLLVHPELRSEMGEKAFAKMQRYDLRKQVDRILGVYREVSDRQKPYQDLELEVLLYDSDQPWSMPIQDMFRQLAEVEKRLKRRLLVCRMDLSDAETIRLARLLLIPSAGLDSLARALQALRWQIPILVDEGAPELKELCLASNAGLFYADPQELQECLKLLLSNEPLRKAMAINGEKFVKS